MSQRIAVTGATGFLGRYVVDAVLQRGHHPVGVVRNPDRVPELRARGIELRRADLTDPEALRAGFRGTDAVVSVAAMVNVASMYSPRRARREEYIRTNVGGIRNVMEAAAAVGVPRVVHISSANVYSERSPLVSEDGALHADGAHHLLSNIYSISKAAAERLAWQMAESHRLSLTTLRPTGIYGAHDTTLMPILRALLRPRISVFPAFTRLQLVHAGDVAEAAMLALEKNEARGAAFNIAGGEETLWELARLWREGQQLPRRFLLPVPLPIRPLLDTERARRVLGWEPRPLREGVAELMAREGATAPDGH